MKAKEMATLVVKKLRKFGAIGSTAITSVKFNFSRPTILHDLIKISLIFNRIIQSNRFELVSFIHPPIIPVQQKFIKSTIKLNYTKHKRSMELKK